jgi:hypothetical protein
MLIVGHGIGSYTGIARGPSMRESGKAKETDLATGISSSRSRLSIFS